MKAATLSSDDVKHIAQLANLIVTSKEVVTFASQLTAILGFISTLGEIPTKNVEPTSHVTGLVNVFRKDEVDESRILTQKDALGNAKTTHNGFFVVPAIFSD